MNTISARSNLDIQRRCPRRDCADNAADFHPLAILQSGHQLFERNTSRLRKWGGAQDRPGRLRNDWREGAGLGDAFYLDQISRLGMVFRFVLYKDAAGLILKKELPAPRGFGGGDDTTNEHGKL